MGAVLAIESAASQTFHWLSPVWRVPSAHTAYLIHSFSSPSSKQPGFHSKPLSSEATLIGLTTSCSWFFWPLQGGILEAPLTVSVGLWSHCAWGSLQDRQTRGRQQSPVLPGRLKDKAFGNWEALDRNGLWCLQHQNGQLSSALLTLMSWAWK